MFRSILQNILDQSHALGVVLMGYDGIAVDQVMVSTHEIDPHLIAVEYANVLREIHRAADVLSSGYLEEVSINTGRFQVILRMLSDEYFVALTMSMDAHVGRARYLLLRDAHKLREELAA